MSQDLLRERGSRDGVYTIGNSAYAAEKAAGNGEQETLGDRGVLPYLAFAGRFVPEKGIADLFAAVALLKMKDVSSVLSSLEPEIFPLGS